MTISVRPIYDEDPARRILGLVLVTMMSFLLLISLVPTGESIEGSEIYDIDIWVKDTSSVGLNNATVNLREAGVDRVGGSVLHTATTTNYQPIVNNETIGTGDGTETSFVVSGIPIVDWNDDDTIDDLDVLVYIDGTKSLITAFDYTEATGKVIFGTAPSDGEVVTATYKWNAGNGHVKFTDVEAGNYVVHVSLTDYYPEYRAISVAGDSVYVMEMKEYKEIGSAVSGGNPWAILGVATGAVIALGVAASKFAR